MKNENNETTNYSVSGDNIDKAFIHKYGKSITLFLKDGTLLRISTIPVDNLYCDKSADENAAAMQNSTVIAAAERF